MIHIFIVNPYAGNRNFAIQIRDKIPKDIESYIFTTTEPKSEPDLVRQVFRIFEGEELRIYSCGGSGTFRNIMNGIDDFSKVELGFIPYGLTNDFLKIFGENEAKFRDFEAMVRGDSVYIDYLKTDHGVALNSLSAGLDLSVMSSVDRYRLFGSVNEGLPYLMALVYSFFFAPNYEYVMSVDGRNKAGKFSELYIGNDGTIGGMVNFKHNPVVNDGIAHSYLVNNVHGFRLIKALNAINKGVILEPKYKTLYDEGRKFTLTRADGRLFELNFDGEIEGPFNSWNVELVEKGLRFILPKGVKLDGL